MRISAIVPCYNAGPYIADTLRSIATQEHPAHEIIVVDDGSTDDSVAQILASGVAVKLLHTERAGCAGARSAGLQAVTADWVAFLDADDIWYPWHLRRAAGILSETHDVAYLAHLDCMYHDTGEVFAPSAGPPLSDLTNNLPATRFLEIFAKSSYFSPSSVIQRLDRVREVGGPDASLQSCEDVELFLRVIHGHTWTFNPERPWRYRLSTPGALSANRMRSEQAKLIALLKNEANYCSPLMQQLIIATSRRVMARAFTEGTLADQDRAWQTAWSHLPMTFRAFFLAMKVWPAPFERIIRLKRRFHGLIH